MEIRFETGNSIIINNFKPYIREYSSERLIHIGYDFYPNLFSGNHSIKVIIYDKLGNHAEQSIIMSIPNFVPEIVDEENSGNSFLFPIVSGILIVMFFIWKKRAVK